MKNSEKVLNHSIEIINNIFLRDGCKEIPSVEQVSIETNLDRSKAIKYLYAWWEKFETYGHPKPSMWPAINLSHNIEENLLQTTLLDLQGLSKELDIYSDSLNNATESAYPLGNFIHNSLQSIENKLFTLLSEIHQVNEDNKLLETELSEAFSENNQLQEEITKMQNESVKQLGQLEDKLDAKKREVNAAKHLVKSLKREKRKPSIKSILYEYKLQI